MTILLRAIAGAVLYGGALRRFTAAAKRAHWSPPPALDPPVPRDPPAFAAEGLPRIATAGELADWLGLTPAELDWFADVHGRLREADPTLRHYAWCWIPKRSGGARLIEAPKPRLKAIQRQILAEILDRLPPHDAAYGFVRGRNCVQAAQKHCGEAMVLSFDLRDFFPCVPARRAHAIFACAGYPASVARLLTGLSTVAAPPEVAARGGPLRRRLAEAHLPQGAPTSPALANLAAFGLDRRLWALARRCGLTYTRYADDMTFSGDPPEGAGAFAGLVGRIAAEEGFALNPRKTRMRGAADRQTVTGIVVNRHVNLRRDAYDALKATLHNCLRHGPQTQNREARPDFRAHLEGRVAWVETLNPRRGAKLRTMLEAVDWAA